MDMTQNTKSGDTLGKYDRHRWCVCSARVHLVIHGPRAGMPHLRRRRLEWFVGDITYGMRLLFKCVSPTPPMLS